MSKLPRPCISLVTDRRLCVDTSLEEKVALAVEGGVNLVQLREKDLPGGRLLALAKRLKSITRDKALFFVNERVDVALACGADGVHLGEEALPVAAVRNLAGDRLLIGRSVHSLKGSLEAEKAGADFLQLGTIFESSSKPGVIPTGLELVKQVTSQVTIPVIGIGGIDASNAARVMACGAWGIAVISAILAAQNPKEAARRLARSVKNATLAIPAPPSTSSGQALR